MISILLLVDFDNLNKSQKENFQLYLEKILSQFIISYDLSDIFIKGYVRLYGGWYEADQLTNEAIELGLKYDQSIIGSLFNKNIKYKYYFSVSLAHSLLRFPEKDFWSTFRKRTNHIRGIRFSNCVKNCSYDESLIPKIIDVISKGSCPHQNCPKYLEDSPIIYKSEQKMVDTLLTCDLIDSAIVNPTYYHVIVVSGDDDLVPPLVFVSASKNANVSLVLPAKRSNRHNVGVIPSCKIWEVL